MQLSRSWSRLGLGAGLVLAGVAALAAVIAAPAQAQEEPPPPTSGELLTELTHSVIGGVIGPDGALYVGGDDGTVTRIDLETGEQTVVATGLPTGTEGGVTDVAFLGEDMYILTTLIEEGGVTGVYRIDDVEESTLIADLGQFALDNPVDFPDAIPTGNPFAIHPAGDGGFIVTDGNHNRVLHVALDGTITVLISFDNIVPTGIETAGETIYISQIGPFPHTPEAGKVVSFAVGDETATDVAAGVPYTLDVTASADALYALSIGDNPPEGVELPAAPGTGKLLLVNADGTYSVLVDGLMLPTSLDIVGDTAVIATLFGQVWLVDGISELEPIVAEPEPVNLQCTLSGEAQIPEAVETDATGEFTGVLNGDGTLDFTLTVTGAGAEFTQAHIHNGAVDATGNPVVFLFGPVDEADAVEDLDEAGTITTEDLIQDFEGDWEGFEAALLSGNAYVNVHSLANPAGEIRCQVAQEGTEPTPEPTEEPTEAPTEVPTATQPAPTATSAPPTATAEPPAPPDVGSAGLATSDRSVAPWIFVLLGAVAIGFGVSTITVVRRR